jgi:DNA (cytosine-5)-methyltransferase 1
MVNEMLTAGSLFSGIGGIDLAFVSAGFDILFQVEIEEFCRKVLTKHGKYWPNATQFMDIRCVGRADLPEVDVLVGGFPCQDISIAGKGAGIEGERSGLWYEFRRLIGELRPRAVLLENVPAITTRGGTTVIGHLAALGYDAEWTIVSAAEAGAPHRRERWICVAYANGLGLEAGKDQQGVVREASFSVVAGSGHIADVGDTERGRRKAQAQIGSVQRRSRSAGFRGNPSGNMAQPRVCRDFAGLSRELDGHRFPAGPTNSQHEWEPPRQIEERDPHWHARIKALGNAVVPQCIVPFAIDIARRLSEGE